MCSKRNGKNTRRFGKIKRYFGKCEKKKIERMDEKKCIEKIQLES